MVDEKEDPKVQSWNGEKLKVLHKFKAKSLNQSCFYQSSALAGLGSQAHILILLFSCTGENR